MKILVLGARGFVGKRLLMMLNNTKDTVFSKSRRDGLDLLDYDNTRNIMYEIKPDIIYNCAAHVGSVHYVTTYAADVFADNVQMTLNLYRAIKEVCPKTIIINPLSNCSYPGNSDVQKENEWWDGQVHHSVYSYGNYKRFVYVTSECYRMQYFIISKNFLIPNTYGPGDSIDPNKTHALNGMIIRMLKSYVECKREFEIWGTGNPIREWIYIDDVVKIMTDDAVLKSDLAYPINIAQNTGYTIKESAQIIADTIGYKGSLVFNENYQDGALKKVLEDKKFRKIFPYFKFVDHKDAIRKTVEYYKSILL